MRYGLIFALVASAVIVAGVIGVAIFGGGFGLDFGVFWRAVREPIDQIYHPDPTLPFVYPPTMIPWLQPLRLLPFWPAFYCWSFLSLACFLAAVRKKTCFLVLLSPAVIECVAFGQTSLFVGSLLLFGCSRRGWQMGALFALAFCLKPQLLITAPLVLLARRDWTAIIGGVVVGILLLSGVTALYGPQIWIDWWDAIPNFAGVIQARHLYWALVTPYGLAASAGLPPTPFWIAGAAIAVAAIVRSADSWGNLAMPITVTSVLAVPYAVPHDLVAALPWCVGVLVRKEFDWRQAPAALIFAISAVPFATLAMAIGWIFNPAVVDRSQRVSRWRREPSVGKSVGIFGSPE